ncbi:DUF2789 family protein [Paraglaciecola hydrolytica]|uniref:DUF2789 domain-containing protein n=1 Tax=Paraglaciecola hydrolytica TaxID=1799789 RepID=A0A135ZYW5_9ALTE|nr:DUF2789 family protein [Paraglaciecola hydrolytica]KXI28171.1 hypothetical protein AX660_17485 [Paraglaciecola hydrolytica]
MEHNHTALSDLFAQLGLSADQEAITEFVQKNAGLPAEIKIENAPIWTKQQAAFLRSALAEDAEWAEVIDQLNALLR